MFILFFLDSVFSFIRDTIYICFLVTGCMNDMGVGGVGSKQIQSQFRGVVFF